MKRLFAILLMALPLPMAAQTPPQSTDGAAMAILTVVPDRLFEETEAGRTATDRYQQASQALLNENRGLEAALATEERVLTEKRATLPVEDFRRMADAFDDKAQQIRRDQDAKSLRITRQRDLDRQLFFQAALPVLAGLMREKRALVILDRSSVFLSFDVIDITDEAVVELNNTLGDGTQVFQSAPETPAP
ncbi:OmpH family outer membrane protein [Falsirhodobacter halotolerans]|uniref:OmpH family outer membrane protein n=1 Tax=Falsirhodobacter halotolerans TaxID=1146892 RepID=UPI001FD4FE16|nr:OmpH family outer membrane protein [Falsirhodobacter halotolerans]MCJ8139644.1 OmpH family outer membrane protein [Falsirhodobacter halotolerans]